MSLMDRFLGSQRSKAYSEGLALLENGNFAASAEHLRIAVAGRADSPSGSLATFHFRQALVSEGRRLLRSEMADDAVPYLAEAVSLWDKYPDLHCLHGAAVGLSGDWESALGEAKTALRLNSDYCEARLLEAMSLRNLDRGLEAADSLNSLIESGRRVDHWLINSLQQKSAFTADNLPDQLDKLMVQAMSGRSEKEDVAEAVSLCRAGKWEQGLKIFGALVNKRPRYPDYRTRYAAALFQVERNEEALQEVDAALGMNESYRTAVDLKGLIMADSGQFLEARQFLADSDHQRDSNRPVTAHEELFGSYLRSVLAILCGDPDGAVNVLAGWPDLVRNFARAELVLACADSLCGRSVACTQRLENLAREWPSESDYFYLLACSYLENGQFNEVINTLSRWPATDSNTTDNRPLFLERCTSVVRGDIPADLENGATTTNRELIGDPGKAAWYFLAARIAFLAKDDRGCWDICTELQSLGLASENLLRIQLAAAGGPNKPAPDSWQPKLVLPESCIAVKFSRDLRSGNVKEAQELIKIQTMLHPESLVSSWLSARFWLDPIRNWIA